MRNWRVVRGCQDRRWRMIQLGSSGRQIWATSFCMTMEFNKVNSEVSVGHSCLYKGWIFPPKGSELSDDQDLWDNSNVEGSKIFSDRLDSDLFLGRASSNSSPQCSDISSIETTASVGKERVLTNLYSLLALWIRISGSKISWKYSASRLLLTLVLLDSSIPQWSHLPKI